MDLSFIDGIGWRDMVLVAAAIIGVYLVLSVMRLFQVGGRRQEARKPELAPDFPAWQPAALIAETQAPPPPSQPVAPQAEFAAELARSSLEVECQSLRRECAQLREELARLGEEVQQLRSTRNMSPHYTEAMALARRGVSANGIAGRCDISIGEAELVAALARSSTEFERHEQGEDRDEPDTDSGNRLHG